MDVVPSPKFHNQLEAPVEVFVKLDVSGALQLFRFVPVNDATGGLTI